MIVPIVCERYADNGELSHYDVINKGTGTLLWEPGENGEVNSVADLAVDRDRLQAELNDRDNDLTVAYMKGYEDGKAIMTARCTAAEEVFADCKWVLLYVREYVKEQGLSAEDDCNEAIEKIDNWLALKNKEDL